MAHRSSRHAFTRSCAVLATLLVLALVVVSRAGADELEELRQENARLKAEVRELSARLGALQDGAATAGADGAASGAAGAGMRVEPIYVPRTRVSLEVGRDAATGKTNIATLWYRTSDAGPLPRKEWMQLRAQQSPAGELDGTWLLVDRQGASGGAKVPAGRLTVDGRDIELPLADYDASRKSQSIGPINSSTRNERIRFAVPASALPLVANARSARFEAGAVSFELTDEHMAAFAALAARLAPAPAAAATAPRS